MTHAITKTKLLQLHPIGSCLALAAVAAAGPALAQQPTPLPPITVTTPTVQGATLERPPVKRAAPAPASSIAAPPKSQGGSAAAPSPSIAPTPVAQGGAPSLVSGVAVETVGTPVSVVTAGDIQAQQARTLPDVLRSLPGVQIAGFGSAGSVAQVRIRGAEGRHTRVILDGIEVNTTKDGEFDFSNLSAEDIDRVEVIRGPMSSLYGAGALGGVINIITKGARGPLGLTVRTEIGSFATKDVAARLAGGNENGYIALSGQWKQTDGFNIAPEGDEKDGTRLSSFALKAGGKVGPDGQLDLTLRHTNKRAEYDGFGDVFARQPFQTADDARNVLWDSNWLAGVNLRFDALGGALTHEFKGNYLRSESVNKFDPIHGFSAGVINNTRDIGERIAGGYVATYRFDTPSLNAKHAISGLLETRRETYTPFSDFGFFDGDGKLRARNQMSAGAEWRGTFADRFTVTAGARHDDNNTFQDFSTWRTSMSYAWREAGLRPHASYGTGVKLPGMYDQFGPNNDDYKSNPNLRAETSRGWDAGIEATLMGGKAVVDVTYFDADLRNRFFLDFDMTDFKSFVNNAAGESTRRGVEVATRFALTPGISLGLAYTFTDAKDANGLREFRRAPHSGRADIKALFAEGRGTASLAVAYTGNRDDRVFFTDQNFNFNTGRYELPGYWLVTLAASYKLQPNLEIYGRIENALDQKYQEVYGYNTAGVAAYAGVKITFDDLAGIAKK